MTYAPYPIRFKPDERAMLKKLARRLERTQSDTVRLLIRGAWKELQSQEKTSPAPAEAEKASA